MLSALDRAIATIAPAWALRRAQARALLSLYEAANPNRGRRHRTDNSSGRAASEPAAGPLRAQARHLERNHDIARGALHSLTANVIGPEGISVEPQPRAADGTIQEELARDLSAAWQQWMLRPEVTWTMDWPAVQRLLFRSWVRDGEVLVQRLMGTVPLLDHGTTVPYSLELIECDQLPIDFYRTEPDVQQGIELNAWGRPRAYYLYKEHPGDHRGRHWASTDVKRVPAARMLHLALRDRIGQLRGISQFASILTRLDDIKDYEESERVAAKVAASMAAVIIKGAPDLYAAGTELDSDGARAPRDMKFRAGMIFDDLRPGETVETIDSKRPNPNVEAYRNGQLRAASGGFGLSYSTFSRDYNGTYSAQRQELVEQYGVYGVVAAEFIHQCARPVYQDFVQLAIASGAVRVPSGVRPETIDDALYQQPAMPWIDPDKEAKAWERLERAGYASGPEIVRKRGRNPRDVMDQEANWRNRARERDLVLTTDPSNDSGGGDAATSDAPATEDA